jgi:hypothetical protein
MRSPFDQALDLQKGSGSIPAALMPNMSEPIPLSPLSTRFTDEGLEACVSQHLATEAITLEWRVRAAAPCSCHSIDRPADVSCRLITHWALRRASVTSSSVTQPSLAAVLRHLAVQRRQHLRPAP